MLIMPNANDVIQRYFSQYLERDLATVKAGEIALVASDRRTKPETGWARAEAVWIHIFDGRAVVSVRPDLVSQLNQLLMECSDPNDLLLPDWHTKIARSLGMARIPGVSHILYCTPENLCVFECDGLRKLEIGDVDAFVGMKFRMYPECDAECLTNDIRRNITDGIAFGVFQNDALVSAADASLIAHMQNEVEEPGVDTLPDYRGRGYGKVVVSQATRRILEIGRVPIYRCDARNEPSVRLALAVGYQKHADKVGFTAEKN